MPRPIFGAVAIAVAMSLLGAQPAAAQAVEYVYTGIDLKACKQVRSRVIEDYGSWTCPGHAGIAVYISSGDQRTFVSFGANARKELANRETLMSFNGEGKTVEWRLETLPDGRKRPFAAIMRWYTLVTADDPAARPDTHRGQVLVVTRLNPGGVCHVGYVDARANPDANDIARRIADERARVFKCGQDAPDSHGQTGPGYSPRMLME